jgi:DNA-binding MarR family transcriptional regulator
LFRSRNYIWDNDHRIVESYGVTWSQFMALASLRSAGPERTLSPTQLYKVVQVTSGGMTKMLHALEHAQLIERVENPADGRSRLVMITPKGIALAEQIIEKLVATNTALIGGILEQSETEELARLLHKLSAGLQSRDAQTE